MDPSDVPTITDADLVENIRSGRAVLFLGAGASFHAADARGHFIPLGGDLKQLIANKFLGPGYSEADFKTVCDFAASSSSVRELQLFIHQTLFPFHPADYHLLIPRFVWSGIATTNYDLIIERAYERVPNRLQNVKPYCRDRDRIAESLATDQILYVKLHGCITQYQDTDPPLVASTEQIVNHRDGRAGQFAQFLEWAKTRTIIFVGYGMGDSNMRILFEEIRKEGDNRPRHYLVRPDIAPVERDYWADRRVRTISCDFKRLLQALDVTISSSTRTLALVAAAYNSTTFTRFISVAGTAESRTLRLFLENQCEHVCSEMLVKPADRKKFYEGFDLGWFPFAEELDVPRRMERVLLDDHITPTSVVTRARFVVLKGHAGAGKSVVLRRVAWNAATKLNKLVLRIAKPSDINDDAIEEIVSITNQTIYLIVDNLSESPESLARLLRKSRARKWPMVFIGGVRTNEWNVRCQEDLDDFVDDEHELGYLSEFEIDDLLGRLELNDCLGHLASLPTQERRLKLRQEYGRQLLVALHEATKNASFRDIIRNEYEQIFPREAQILYLDVCALHRFGAPVRAGLIARVHGITFDAFKSEFFKPLERVIDVAMDPKSNDWVYQARHSYIAEIVYEEAIRTVDERFEHVLRIVGRLNPTYSYDREILFELVRAHTLANVFSERRLGRAIYEKALGALGREVGVLHQWSLYEMRLAETGDDLDIPERLLSEARDLAPKNTRVQHSIAELALKRASFATNEVERAAWRTRAEQLAKTLIRHDSGPYPHHTLAKAAVQEVRDQLKKTDEQDNELSQEALSRSIGKAEEVIRSGLKTFANDSHLLAEESQLRVILKQADKALPPLQRAFHESPQSELIALRLARLLDAQNKADEGISVLRKALDFNPGKQSLHYCLAQLLLNSAPNASTKIGDSILYHLARSFTTGDKNYEAQFWYARQLCLSGMFPQAKTIFATLRALAIPYKQKHEPRGLVLDEQGLPVRYYGQVRFRSLDYGFIYSDNDRIEVYFWSPQPLESKDQFPVDARVTFCLTFSLAGPAARDAAPV